MKYNDPWKLFRLKLLKQIDYFNLPSNQPEFFDEVNYYMEEEFYEQETEILHNCEKCTKIIFIVQGRLNLVIRDPKDETHVLATLRQGDNLGQYSCLFNEGFVFSIVAQTNVRLLTLSQQFFLDNLTTIDGLKRCVMQAENYVEEHGIPICDFKIF